MLTDRVLKSYLNKSQQKELVIADREGLSVRILKSGRITFLMRYRFNGKSVKLAIGNYPAISLKYARDEHRRLKKELSNGHDPRQLLQLEKSKNIQQATTTFEYFFYNWYESYVLRIKSVIVK